ncbi:hypothetical protein FD723_40820 (plasmid) [Nostoc sp. C052]|uniref:DUF5895 domain-containing protein n=1 Tax=Nostoc sp. C052 TaxID=2576902 RepID=UPI0015C311BD|nr:DUF5895 domain-containing protein [Nostoc sp. C052]QLE46559.1 hypothetical protein FD723_40820 [Nostoc sp. C052]
MYNFEDSKFDAQLNFMPWAQIINPRFDDQGIKPYGLAIKMSNAQAVGLVPDETFECIEYSFSSGKEEVLISMKPRISVVSKGALYIKERETGVKVGLLRDNYDLFSSDKLRYKTYNRCVIFLFGSNGALLHEQPLQITLSGASGASFNKAYAAYDRGMLSGGFAYDLQTAYSSFREQKPSGKGQLFYAHGIFCPIFDCEEKVVGDNTFAIATVADYEHPTATNLSQYLIRNGTPESNIITENFEKHKDFGKETAIGAPSTRPMATVSSGFNQSYGDEDDDSIPWG